MVEDVLKFWFSQKSRNAMPPTRYTYSKNMELTERLSALTWGDGARFDGDDDEEEEVALVVPAVLPPSSQLKLAALFANQSEKKEKRSREGQMDVVIKIAALAGDAHRASGKNTDKNKRAKLSGKEEKKEPGSADSGSEEGEEISAAPSVGANKIDESNITKEKRARAPASVLLSFNHRRPEYAAMVPHSNR
jgi:hypothetical protein